IGWSEGQGQGQGQLGGLGGLGDDGVPSARGSGKKSMRYMKDVVMTGTRKIARHVPKSMPKSKGINIQRHIPLPKGVPKIPYRRSTHTSMAVTTQQHQHPVSFPGPCNSPVS
ncbi:unnamed protein product, partial [Discosporangium mesarthrocarpum]